LRERVAASSGIANTGPPPWKITRKPAAAAAARDAAASLLSAAAR